MNLRRSCLLVLALCLLHPAMGRAAPECLSIRSRFRGTLETRCESIEFGRLTRTYRIYVPANPHNPAPLILVLHGGGGSGSGQEMMTKQRINRIADREGLIVVYPDGVGRNWNDGRHDLRAEAAKKDVDDVGFLRELIRVLSARFHVDSKRVYATGMSNGGFMSFRLACDAADVIAAVAPVAANLPAELAPDCKPAQPIPVAMFSGTDDPIVPWNGGSVSVFGMKRGQTLSAVQTFETWSKLDGCRKSSTGEPVDRVVADGTSLLLHTRTDCNGGAEVRLYEIRGGGHAWPGGVPYLGERLVGRVSSEIDASDEVWSFFSRR
jgi:polyhydroxybutyrate depolymerase